MQARIRSLAVPNLPEGATRRWDIHGCESTDALGSLSFTNLQNVLHNQRERESSSDTATRWQMQMVGLIRIKSRECDNGEGITHLLWFQLELLASDGERNVRHGPKTGTVHG